MKPKAGLNTKTTDKVRYGVISTASIVPRFCRGMELSGNGMVSAISSRDPLRAEKTAAELSIPKTVTDHHEILDDPDIDAVYIPLINSLHYPYAKEALLAGKHVVMEKPFVLHAGEAEELFALAEEKKPFLTEAVKTPFLPLYQKILELIRSGTLGEIRYMDFRQSYNSGPYISGWNREKDCGGVLYGNEAYFFSMAEYLNGPIASCYGNASFFESGAEQQCSLSVRFANNTMAALAVSNQVLFENGLTIYLDHGRIVIPDYWKASEAQVYHDSDGSCETISCPCPWELQYELRHYNTCILNGMTASPVTVPEKTIRYIRFCENLRQMWDNEKKF